jgi:hypothetical protein
MPNPPALWTIDTATPTQDAVLGSAYVHSPSILADVDWSAFKVCAVLLGPVRHQPNHRERVVELWGVLVASVCSH